MDISPCTPCFGAMKDNAWKEVMGVAVPTFIEIDPRPSKAFWNVSDRLVQSCLGCVGCPLESENDEWEAPRVGLTPTLEAYEPGVAPKVGEVARSRVTEDSPRIVPACMLPPGSPPA
jgi:hypothetical protein